MLSRVADSLYWMGRYLERAEQMARLLEVTRDLLVDLSAVDPQGAAVHWKATVATLGVPDTTVDALTFDSEEPTSIASCMQYARENARQVREVISAEMWEHLNQAYWALEEARAQPQSEARLVQALTSVQTASFLWDGVTDGCMSRGEGWLFLKLGKYLERADRLGRAIAVRVASRPRVEHAPVPQENVMWLTLLRSAGALEAYRKAHPTRVDERSVLGFLVFDRDFPRAIRHGTRAASELAERLSALHASPGDPVARAFGRMAGHLDYASVDELLDRGPVPFLNELLAEANTAGLLLARTYFLQ